MSEIRGPRVDREYGWWLTWEESDMGGATWRYEQRRLTLAERVLYKLFGRVPRP